MRDEGGVEGFKGMIMKTLPSLKADCMIQRNLSEAYPDNKAYMRDYEKAQRAVEAKERELFCDIHEQETQ